MDIRKNEHFGDIYIFKYAFTSNFKSEIKKSRNFFIKEKRWNKHNQFTSHHNITNRIKAKSYKNILSLKKKTIKILKNILILINFQKKKHYKKCHGLVKSREIFQQLTD